MMGRYLNRKTGRESIWRARTGPAMPAPIMPIFEGGTVGTMLRVVHRHRIKQKDVIIEVMEKEGVLNDNGDGIKLRVLV